MAGYSEHTFYTTADKSFENIVCQVLPYEAIPALIDKSLFIFQFN